VIATRARRGRFREVSDLALVEGMPDEVYSQALPFVTVKREHELEKRHETEIRAGAIGRTHRGRPSSYIRGESRFLTHGGVGALLALRPRPGGVNDARAGWMCRGGASAWRARR